MNVRFTPGFGAPRPLSAAVQHLLSAHECIHAEHSVPQSQEQSAVLGEMATQLRAQICTLVNLLRPMAHTPDLSASCRHRR